MPYPSTFGVVVLVAAVLALARKRWCRKTPVTQVHLRGRSVRTAAEVVELLSKNYPSRPLRIGRREFPAQIATGHLAFIGTTGSGKTLLQRLLMQSALSSIGHGNGHGAVVYDAKQDVLSTLSGMDLEVPIYLLNPFDNRSVWWDMAADITNPAAALQVASTLVPVAKSDANPFFTNAARHLLYGVLLALIERAPGRWTFRHVLLLIRDSTRLYALLLQSENTRHLHSYFSHPATTQNIFSTILTYTSPYEIIAACWDRAGESLSLSKWRATESILILGNDEQNRTALDTINKLLFGRLAELVLAEPEVDDRASDARRTWFFLDEVREAGKLDLLGRLLTKGRSKGVAVSLGFQDISGMREVYGREVADEILGQCNTKIILRLNSPETAAWAAKLFGNREVLESRRSESKNRRFSLNRETSSGESLSHAIAQQPLLLDSEILGLPEISRENGVRAFFISPQTGPFCDHIDSAWLSKHLLPPDSGTENFIARPDEHQYLRPWDSQDDALLAGAPPGREESFSENASCQ